MAYYRTSICLLCTSFYSGTFYKTCKQRLATLLFQKQLTTNFVFQKWYKHMKNMALHFSSFSLSNKLLKNKQNKHFLETNCWLV